MDFGGWRAAMEMFDAGEWSHALGENKVSIFLSMNYIEIARERIKIVV